MGYMGKFIDMTGQRCGRLTVVGQIAERDALGNVRWQCLCDCGKQHVTNGIGLRHGRVRSCGCLQKDSARALPITQPESLKERFERHVVRRGPDECWGWIGCKNPHGYNQLRYGGKNSSAHRLSYELHHGPISPGLCILHSCDNPECTNPRHLRQGTVTDNARDMMDRNRAKIFRGEAHGKSKLTTAAVLEMRELFGVVSLRKLALRYGVAKKTILDVKNGKTWNSV